jgi:putative transposase
MPKSRFTEAQIMAILKESEAGAKTAKLCRKHGVSKATFYRWRSQFRGMDLRDPGHLRELEERNRRLKKIVTERLLESPSRPRY